jgi:hypothetical protein
MVRLRDAFVSGLAFITFPDRQSPKQLDGVVGVPHLKGTALASLRWPVFDGPGQPPQNLCHFPLGPVSNLFALGDGMYS